MGNGHTALGELLRLRAGLSPLARVADLTVDLQEHTRYLDALFETQLHRRRPLGIVTGPPGWGKTNFLGLAKTYALSQGFAVMQLGQDTGLASLAHPQRHISLLLTSLALPEPHGLLFAWLAAALEDRHESCLLASRFEGLRRQSSDSSGIAERALWEMRSSHPSRIALTLEYLSGAPLAAKTPLPLYRLRAYELLRFWVFFCTQILGCKGVVMLLDELENLFVSAIYPSSMSRRAAYRTLAAYCISAADVIPIAAFTSEGWRSIRSEIDQEARIILGYATRLAEEDVAGFAASLLAVQAHHLRPLDSRDYRELTSRLLRLHAEARGYVSLSGVDQLRVPVASPEMTPRIYARSIVSTLEALWFDGLLSLAAKTPASGRDVVP
jgi:hypothetical protein